MASDSLDSKQSTTGASSNFGKEFAANCKLDLGRSCSFAIIKAKERSSEPFVALTTADTEAGNYSPI